MNETDRQLFDRIARDYCAKDLYAPSRLARQLRLTQSFDRVTNTEACTVLEVGCGAGFAANYLMGKYSTFVGVDYSENLVQYATEINRHESVEFSVADVNSYAPPHPVDAILMIGVLHHLENPVHSLGRMTPWLKPGGWLVANEPSGGNPLVSLARRVRKRIDQKYSDEQIEVRKAELLEWARKAGLVDSQIWCQGIFSTPFAEVMIRPEWLASTLSSAACRVDRILERHCQRFLKHIAWNLILVARRAN